LAASLDIEGVQDEVSVQALAQRTSSVLERLRDAARSARADDRREPAVRPQLFGKPRRTDVFRLHRALKTTVV